jgi:hypothetical protein
MISKANVKEFETLYGDDVIKLENGVEYHHIHPFSDEDKLLKEINVILKDIYKVDAYIKYNGDIIFYETILKGFTNYFSPGLYLKAEVNKRYKLSALNVLDESQITRLIFEESLLGLIKCVGSTKLKDLIILYGLTPKYKQIDLLT